MRVKAFEFDKRQEIILIFSDKKTKLFDVSPFLFLFFIFFYFFLLLLNINTRLKSIFVSIWIIGDKKIP